MQIWEVLLTWFVEPPASHAAILELPVAESTQSTAGPSSLQGLSWELLWKCPFEPQMMHKVQQVWPHPSSSPGR